MAKTFELISDELKAWVSAQPMFFVASAPIDAAGLVNCSPKGLDSLRILGPKTVAYLDLTGSGAETAAHVRENGRLVIMLCAFSGPPRIVRFHGTARAVFPGDSEWDEVSSAFSDTPGARAIFVLEAKRISDSCGYAVPEMDYKGQRDTLIKWAERKGSDGIERYQNEKNAQSLDGLPAVP
ncbi:MAG: pyridoxamine 5'-phosphate oxidase family protein [Verrucomicrobiota bacterium]